MNYLKFEPIKLEGEDVSDGRKTLYVDVTPQKSCIYNCIFCTREKCHMGPVCDFGDVEDSLTALREEIQKTNPDIVFLFAQGDPLTNDKIDRIIDCCHQCGVPVRTIANGLLLGREYRMREANMCDEVVGCLAMVREEPFQKLHRPYPGLSCEKKLESLIEFSRQYKGKFIFRIVMIKGWNDSEEDLAIIKSLMKKVRYDELSIQTRPNTKGGDRFAVEDDRMEEIRKYLTE